MHGELTATELTATELTIDLGGRTVKIRIIKDLEPLFAKVKDDDDIPFWADLWPAAVGLARYIWQHTNTDLAGKQTLELGAGLGLPGITASLKGAQVLETDFIDRALVWAQENAHLNGLFNLTYRQADWRDFQVPGQYDIILGSDILYEPKLQPSLELILERSLKPKGTAYFSDPGRRYAGEFIARISEQGWIVQDTVISVEMDGSLNEIHVYAVCRRDRQ